MAGARRIQRFVTEPFFVAEQLSGKSGRQLKLADTIRSFREILDREYDDLPGQAFYMVGTIEAAQGPARDLTAQNRVMPAGMAGILSKGPKLHMN